MQILKTVTHFHINVFSFWGEASQVPTRGFAPGLHWGTAPRLHSFPPTLSDHPPPMRSPAVLGGGCLNALCWFRRAFSPSDAVANALRSFSLVTFYLSS